MATWQIVVAMFLTAGIFALIYFSGTDDSDPYDD